MSNSITIKGKIKSLSLESLTVTKANGERRISGWASKPTRDRGGDIVEPTAFASSINDFMGKNPAMLYMHNHSKLIGTWDEYKLTSEGLWMSGTMVTGVKDADEAWILAKHGALRTLSIGYIEKDGDMEDDGYHIKDLELLEVSPVSIPMNGDALFTVEGGKSINMQLIEEDEEVTEDEETKEAEEAETEVQGAGEGEVLNPEEKESNEMFPDLTIPALLCEIEQLSAILESTKSELSETKTEIQEVKRIAEDVQQAFYKYIVAQVKRAAGQSGVTN